MFSKHKTFFLPFERSPSDRHDECVASFRRDIPECNLFRPRCQWDKRNAQTEVQNVVAPSDIATRCLSPLGTLRLFLSPHKSFINAFYYCCLYLLFLKDHRKSTVYAFRRDYMTSSENSPCVS